MKLSRRKFLKGAAALAAVPTFGGALLKSVSAGEPEFLHLTRHMETDGPRMYGSHGQVPMLLEKRRENGSYIYSVLYDANVFEAMVYDRRLSDTEYDKLVSYVREKYPKALIAKDPDFGRDAEFRSKQKGVHGWYVSQRNLRRKNT